MKPIIFSYILLLMILGCQQQPKTVVANEHENHKVKVDNSGSKKVLSPHTSAMALVGDAHIHIDYSSPGVRGRIIFGGLLAYGEVWQSGAHNATWLETNKDLLIDGKILKAGKYGLFTIPNQDRWTIIFNRNWEQHGKDEYDEKDDVLRFDIKPEISDELTEQLTYHVEKVSDSEGNIYLSWEKTRVGFPFSVLQ